MKFWLEMGVDGFRLDAVPYLVEREGTSCENLPANACHHPASCANESIKSIPARCF